MYVCMFVCMFVCMYVCLYARIAFPSSRKPNYTGPFSILVRYAVIWAGFLVFQCVYWGIMFGVDVPECGCVTSPHWFNEYREVGCKGMVALSVCFSGWLVVCLPLVVHDGEVL